MKKTIKLKYNEESLDFEGVFDLCREGIDKFFKLPETDTIYVVISSVKPKGNNFMENFKYHGFFDGIVTKRGRYITNTYISFDDYLNMYFSKYDVVYGWIEVDY